MARVVELIDLLPPRVQGLVWQLQERTTMVNTICTNVPGPSVPLYLQGQRLECLAPFVPLIERMGVAFAVLSYNGSLTIGITADRGLVPDVRLIVTAVTASFEELRGAAGVAARPRHACRTTGASARVA
jgi:hypothetical protein